MKRLLMLLVASIVFVLGVHGQTPIPSKPYPERLVNDFAKSLTAADVASLEKKLVDIDKKTGIQIAVVCIPELHGDDPVDFATNLGNNWGVGHKDDRGVVILVAMNGYWAIVAGRKLEGELLDVTCKHIGEESLVPNYQNKKYFQMFDQTVDKLMSAAGMMSWDDRLKHREIQAQIAAKNKESRLAAEKADKEFKDKKRQEAWDSFMNTVAIIAMILLPFAIIYFFYILYRDWKIERKRRKELAQKRQMNWMDVHGTMTNISTFCEDIPFAPATYPTWVYNEITAKYNEAKSLQSNFLDAYNNIEVFTKKRIKKADKSNYETLYAVLTSAVGELTDMQSFIFNDIFAEYRKEVENKKIAIEKYNTAVRQCEEVCKKLLQQNYKLDSYQHLFDVLVAEFNDCVKNEEKLGKNFDNQVDEIVNKIKHLEQRISILPITQKNTAEAVPEVKSFLASVNDEKVRDMFDSLSKKYQKDAWGSTRSKWESMIGKISQHAQILQSVEAYNTMQQQRIEEAHTLLLEVNQFVSLLKTHKKVILSLDTTLQDAKHKTIAKKNAVEQLVPSVKMLMTNSDVIDSTERSANTLLTKVVNFASAIAVSPQPDWISNLEIAESLYKSISDIKTKMKNEITAAENAREQARLAAIEAQQRAARDAEIARQRSQNNDGGGGFSGFGGGSFGGGGAGGRM